MMEPFVFSACQKRRNFMSDLIVTVICPKCGQPIEAPLTGKYKKVLGKILQYAGHQPGDKIYAEIMEKINFPGE
jgi:ribosomal protein S27E